MSRLLLIFGFTAVVGLMAIPGQAHAYNLLLAASQDDAEQTADVKAGAHTPANTAVSAEPTAG